jgi:hypothetical protein
METFVRSHLCDLVARKKFELEYISYSKKTFTKWATTYGVLCVLEKMRYVMSKGISYFAGTSPYCTHACSLGHKVMLALCVFLSRHGKPIFHFSSVKTDFLWTISKECNLWLSKISEQNCKTTTHTLRFTYLLHWHSGNSWYFQLYRVDFARVQSWTN